MADVKRFRLTLTCANAAFEDPGDPDDEDYVPEHEMARGQETARILMDVARVVDAGGTEGKCRDANGNTVGDWRFDTIRI